jgi:hypothetical protein
MAGAAPFSVIRPYHLPLNYMDPAHGNNTSIRLSSLPRQGYRLCNEDLHLHRGIMGLKACIPRHYRWADNNKKAAHALPFSNLSIRQA